jgi:glyoxylase-like metal-dependent hydrolase (beta-lactamase superfamily II)
MTLENPNYSNTSIRVHSVQAGMSVAHLIETDAGLVLVDAGLPGYGYKILRKMQELDRSDLRLIFITHAHFDHYGSAAVLRRITGAPIAVHAADAQALAQGKTPLGSPRSWGIFGKLLLPLGEWLRTPEATPPDIVVEDGYCFKELDFNACVIHTPGHTPGSSSLFVNGRLVFIGDLILSYPWLHTQRYYADDWAQVSASVDRIIQLDVEWVFPGHGPPVRGERLQKFVIKE